MKERCGALLLGLAKSIYYVVNCCGVLKILSDYN